MRTVKVAIYSCILQYDGLSVTWYSGSDPIFVLSEDMMLYPVKPADFVAAVGIGVGIGVGVGVGVGPVREGEGVGRSFHSCRRVCVCVCVCICMCMCVREWV
jgi:hypothetical protein